MMLPTVPCRRCGRLIVWAVTDANGRPLPCDPNPDPTGNTFLRYEDGRIRATAQSADNPTPEGVRHIPHFATCSRR